MLKKVFLIAIGVLFLSIVIKAVKFAPFIFQLVLTRDVNLKKADDNINLLLLGTGGGTHEGPNLTDTIIFASIDSAKNKINLVSLPRDLWIPDLPGRINAAYAQGEEKGKGKGIILSKAVVAKVLDKPVDYVVKIDFAGFVKVIDILEGIQVEVQNSFDDNQYPISGKENDTCQHKEEEIEKLVATSSSELETFPCRYKKIHFDNGLQRLTGEKALEFVRSRHAEGEEGSDFARSKRQELVIAAIKDKALSLPVLLSPYKMSGLSNALKESINTNIKDDELDDFIRLFQKVKNAILKTTVLDYGDSKAGRVGLLVNPAPSAEFNYGWILLPRTGNGNFSEIQQYVTCQIKTGNCSVTATGISSTSGMPKQ